MAKSFRDLRARMSPQAQEAAAKKTRAMLDEMPIYFVVSEQTGYSSVTGILQEPIYRNIVSATSAVSFSTKLFPYPSKILQQSFEMCSPRR